MRSPLSAPVGVAERVGASRTSLPMIDDGEAIHYTAVAAGTPVYSSDEVEVGKVEAVLDNYREHIFDGIVFEDTGGDPALRRRARGGPNRRARRDAEIDAEAGGERLGRERATPSFRPNGAPAGSVASSAAAGSAISGPPFSRGKGGTVVSPP